MDINTLSDAELWALDIAKIAHEGITYGKSDMLSQVVAVAEEIKENSVSLDKESSVIAALLHKTREKNRLKKEFEPLSIDFVRETFGNKVADILTELSSEPSVEGLSKEKENELIADWVKGLSQEAREILLAEKVVNLRTSAENPNMKKPPEWHLNYVATRMPVIEALSSANEKMYKRCLMYAEQVIQRFSTHEKVCGHDDNGIQKAKEKAKEQPHIYQ